MKQTAIDLLGPLVLILMPMALGNRAASLPFAGISQMPSNAALKAYAQPSPSLLLQRVGFEVPGDSAGVTYRYSPSPCPRADDGLQVKADAGGCWFAIDIDQRAADVRIWGARGDDNVDDGQAISNALYALATLGGGSAYLTPTGKAYRIATGISQPLNGTKLIGVGVANWSGAAALKSAYLASASWLDCADIKNACVTFAGSGDVDGVNFWWDQPTPSKTLKAAWIPKVYPYAVVFRQEFSHARNIFFADAFNGLDFEFLESSKIAGSFSGFEHIYGGAFKNFIRVKSANDTMTCSDVHDRTMWNVGNPNMMQYQLANEIGWDIEYWDNPQCTNVEFYKDFIAMYFADSTADYGSRFISHASEHFSFTNFSFNLVHQAISIQNSTTHLSGRFTNTLAQSDTDSNSAAPYFFNLASNFADVSFDGLEVPMVGRSLFVVGSGSSGKLRVSGLNIGNPLRNSGGAGGYGYLAPDDPSTHVFVLAKGSSLDLPDGTQSITAATIGSITGCVSSSNCGSVLPLMTAKAPNAP